MPKNGVESGNNQEEDLPLEESLYSGVSGVVGGSENEQREALLYLGEAFMCQGGKTFFENGKEYSVEDFEREKSPEENRVVEAIIEKMPGFVQRYKGAGILLNLVHFHFLDRNKIISAGLPPRSFYANSEQFIGICGTENLLANAQSVVHEALHFSSFQTSQIKEQGFLDLRRSGFAIKLKGKKDEIYFGDIDEAIITELTKKFDREFFGGIPELKECLDQRREFIEHFLQKGQPDQVEIAKDIAYVKSNLPTFSIASSDGFSYTNPESREKLALLTEEIQQQNADKYSSPDEVFEIFTRAVMQGDLLPVARLVEKTSGKGSFRKLGEETK